MGGSHVSMAIFAYQRLCPLTISAKFPLPNPQPPFHAYKQLPMGHRRFLITEKNPLKILLYPHPSLSSPLNISVKTHMPCRKMRLACEGLCPTTTRTTCPMTCSCDFSRMSRHKMLLLSTLRNQQVGVGPQRAVRCDRILIRMLFSQE